MASRAYWSGQIRLSLVSIPVDVLPATQSGAKISFHQIHKPSGARVRYQKMVPGKGPVENDEIVKGYELDKGKYVLLSDAEIDKIKLAAKKTIDLVQFVDLNEIDPAFFERPFFVLPEEDSDAEAFVVLRDALRKKKKMGLGQIVIRGKGSVVAIRAFGKGMMLETLRYAGELKKSDTVFKAIPDLKPAADLVDLAEELIERKAKKFVASAFVDTYEKALHELIDAKAEHRQVRDIEEPQQSAKVIDLMEALRKSVGRGGKETGRGAKNGRNGKVARGRRSAA
ncbi:MAG TPA: Ku protein [Xanthobacteraceae bacterium]|nr:Ku protein [Xanthobacteraceae bacterium]